MSKNYKLSIHEIEGKDNTDRYTKLLREKWGNNVYYSIAHLEYFLAESQKLMYFLYKEDESVKVLMPFILRRIESNGVFTEYYDVISPYGYNGPLFCKSIEKEVVVSFWESIDKWYQKNNVVTEFIRFSLNNNHKYYSGTLIDSLINVKGDLLENLDDQWTAFLPKVRNNYRKALKSDLKFKIFEKENLTKDVIAIFYKIYTKTMSRNNAGSLYFFPKSYFEKLVLSNNNNFTIAVVYYKDIPISVELNIHHEQTVYAFLGGTDSEYFAYRPNDFLRVKIIEWAIDQGKKDYVLGGGIKNGDGLYRSKRAFFPKNEEVVFYTGRKVLNAKIYEELNLRKDENYMEVKSIALTDYFFPYYRINN
ncbi:GNAT family N-acetyltransferase [Aquimarina agarilytica]|uniref:GNAT family N-acetyltransferase n=1 Tax=Aquimarina agarilytica TaxID=1087449 RepID=UPI000288D9F6|nr:GNAT family N-acetyltransferase [Aquimarina agarilytica]